MADALLVTGTGTGSVAYGEINVSITSQPVYVRFTLAFTTAQHTDLIANGASFFAMLNAAATSERDGLSAYSDDGIVDAQLINDREPDNFGPGLAANTAYMIDMLWDASPGTGLNNYPYEIRVDGVTVASGTVFGTSLNTVGILRLGSSFNLGDGYYVGYLKVGTTTWGSSDVVDIDFGTVGSVAAAFDSTTETGGGTLSLGAPPADIGTGGGTVTYQRVGIAFNDTTLEPDPTWTYLDNEYPNLVAEFEIERGRRSEFETNDTAQVTVTINDPDGILDPLNADGPYFGLIEPRLQVKLSRRHAVTGVWYTRFRGFIDDLAYELDPTQRNMRLVITCSGIFAILSKIEMIPGSFGDPNPSTEPGAEGTVFYEDGPIQTRLDQLMADAQIPADWVVHFTGNIEVQETTYSAGENVMVPYQEAATAEFPDVSNLYEDRLGRSVFHGRFARFDPLTVEATASPGAWDYNEWQAGDEFAVQASPTDTAQIRGFSFNRGLDKIVNAARATYMGIPRTDVASATVTDATSITKYGVCSWSKDDLIIKGGLDVNVGDPLAECQTIAQYKVDNFKNARNRVTKIVFKSLLPADYRAGALWDLLCQVDISDHITLTGVKHPASTGFVNVPYAIEGVREIQKPLGIPDVDYVELELDVSPIGAFPA